MGVVLNVQKEDYDAIVAHCTRELPNEACGLLAGNIEGEVKTVKKVYLLTNIDNSPEHFSMDVREQLAASKAARAEGLSLVGSFHSHPESLPEPSEEDKRLAYDTDLEYLILSLMEKGNPVLRAFGIDEKKNVTEHEIRKW